MLKRFENGTKKDTQTLQATETENQIPTIGFYCHRVCNDCFCRREPDEVKNYDT
jgi:hypothetical protein